MGDVGCNQDAAAGRYEAAPILWQVAWGYKAMRRHAVAVIPSQGIVVVHRGQDEPSRENVAGYRDVDGTIRMIVAAAPGTGAGGGRLQWLSGASDGEARF